MLIGRAADESPSVNGSWGLIDAVAIKSRCCQGKPEMSDWPIGCR
jgi:hypothetical protein